MFTGLIECTGRIHQVIQDASGTEITIQTEDIAPELALGDSVSVNGICLTATNISPTTFTAFVSNETRSRLGKNAFREGQLVNLERAMALGDRFGGHIVSGHIDGIGSIKDIYPEESAYIFYIALPADLQQWTVEKGSIAINGISLTIARLLEDGVELAVIPHSLTETNLRQAKKGDLVNVEGDMFAKYIKKYVDAYQPTPDNKTNDDNVLETLVENGFLI